MRVTFSEYCEEIGAKELNGWQKVYLDKCYDIAEQLQTPFIFRPIRKDGLSHLHALITILLYDYMRSKK